MRKKSEQYIKDCLTGTRYDTDTVLTVSGLLGAATEMCTTASGTYIVVRGTATNSTVLGEFLSLYDGKCIPLRLYRVVLTPVNKPDGHRMVASRMELLSIRSDELSVLLDGTAHPGKRLSPVNIRDRIRRGMDRFYASLWRSVAALRIAGVASIISPRCWHITRAAMQTPGITALRVRGIMHRTMALAENKVREHNERIKNFEHQVEKLDDAFETCKTNLESEKCENEELKAKIKKLEADIKVRENITANITAIAQSYENRIKELKWYKEDYERKHSLESADISFGSHGSLER